MTPVFGAPEGWDAFLLARRRGEFAGPILMRGWHGWLRRWPS